MIDFVKKVREEGENGEFKGLIKPKTWLSDLDFKIDNKFKNDKIYNDQSLKKDEVKNIDSTQNTPNLITDSIN
jgi:hypothetical protein